MRLTWIYMDQQVLKIFLIFHILSGKKIHYDAIHEI